jgi:hypothetical protein
MQHFQGVTMHSAAWNDRWATLSTNFTGFLIPQSYDFKNKR